MSIGAREQISLQGVRPFGTPDAHDESTPPPPERMDDTIAAAEAALTQSLSDLSVAQPRGTRELPHAVGSDVHRYCEAARAGGLPPEQALIRLKALVAAAYPRRELANGLTAADIVWAAVQRCVKAFYHTNAAPRK